MPHFFLTSGFDQHLIGKAAKIGESTGFLKNIMQFQKEGMKIPYSLDGFANSTYMDDYITRLIQEARRGRGTDFDIYRLLGSYDFDDISEQNLTYTLTSEKFTRYCFMTVAGEGGRPTDEKDCQNAIVSGMMSIINSAYLNMLAGKHIESSIQKMPYISGVFPILEQVRSLPTSGMISISIILLFPLPVLISALVLEKQKIREMMKLNGMKMEYYWMFNLVWNYSYYLIVSFGSLLLALIFGFNFMRHGNLFINILTILVWGFSLLGLSVLLSALFKNVMTAMILTYMLALFEPIVGIFLTKSLGTNWKTLPLYLIIPLPLHLALENGIIIQCERFNCPGWSSLIEWSPVTVGLLFMILDGFLYLFLGFYLNEVLPNDNGVRRSVFYCFKPIYKPICNLMCKKKARSTSEESQPLMINRSHKDENGKDEYIEEDADVTRERIDLEKNRESSMIVIDNLTKHYGLKIAVENLTFSIKNNSIFSLLGANGAGKTTTLSILSGLYSPTSGTAYVNGFDICENMDEVRMSLGLCPQHDVHWDDLTISEHLYFYARMKGVSPQEEKERVELATRLVGLEGIDKYSSELSGGMKRRLSIAISIVGNPSVVLLDEPTTGLDPTSKRQIWDILNTIKKSKCVILTTHSLEEADVLSDRIGIMSHGHLMCIGTSQHLKTKYGEGYRLSVSFDPQNESSVKNYIQTMIPKAHVISQFTGSVTFGVPIHDIKVSEIFAEIETSKVEKKIKNWGLSQTSLEDVFMRIVNSDEGVTN